MLPTYLMTINYDFTNVQGIGIYMAILELAFISLEERLQIVSTTKKRNKMQYISLKTEL